MASVLVAKTLAKDNLSHATHTLTVKDKMYSGNKFIQ